MTATAVANRSRRLPPELLGAVPRDVRLTAGGSRAAVAAIALAVGALVSRDRHVRRLHADGAPSDSCASATA